jgi:RNA polymerase sigma-70 factor (ECF subfamily)
MMADVPDPSELMSLRALAVSVAYRMVGSRTEAEDLAQEAMVRVARALDEDEIRSPEAFTTTVTTRLAIDHLRLARVQRETYVGPWLPEPVVDDELGPAAAAELSDSLSLAFLVVLESLGPVERAAFLLREVFGFDYAQVADALGRSEDACRQVVSRAKQRVGDRRVRFGVDRDEHRRLLERFVAAARDGDVEELTSFLTADVVLVSDGGPTVKAARRPIHGVDRVARFLSSVGPKALGAGEVRLAPVNGEPGFVVVRAGRIVLAGTIDVADGVITAVRWVINPDKLHWMSAPPA